MVWFAVRRWLLGHSRMDSSSQVIYWRRDFFLLFTTYLTKLRIITVDPWLHSSSTGSISWSLVCQEWWQCGLAWVFITSQVLNTGWFLSDSSLHPHQWLTTAVAVHFAGELSMNQVGSFLFRESYRTCCSGNKNKNLSRGWKWASHRSRWISLVNSNNCRENSSFVRHHHVPQIEQKLCK